MTSVTESDQIDALTSIVDKVSDLIPRLGADIPWLSSNLADLKAISDEYIEFCLPPEVDLGSSRMSLDIDPFYSIGQRIGQGVVAEGDNLKRQSLLSNSTVDTLTEYFALLDNSKLSFCEMLEQFEVDIFENDMDYGRISKLLKDLIAEEEVAPLVTYAYLLSTLNTLCWEFDPIIAHEVANTVSDLPDLNGLLSANNKLFLIFVQSLKNYWDPMNNVRDLKVIKSLLTKLQRLISKTSPKEEFGIVAYSEYLTLLAEINITDEPYTNALVDNCTEDELHQLLEPLNSYWSNRGDEVKKPVFLLMFNLNAGILRKRNES